MYRRHTNPGGEFWLPTTRLNLEPEWYALGLSSDEPDKFQGYHSENILIIVDEPSGLDEQIFEAIEGIMAGGNAKLLLIGNPMSMSGTYRDSHLDPTKAQFYNQIHISAFDSPNVKTGKTVIPGLTTQKWMDEKKEDWGEDNPLYRIRVLGEFAEQGVDTLINLDWINQAVKRYEQDDKREGDKVMGVDVARFGDDETVYGIRQGSRLFQMQHWSKWDTMKTANWLNPIITTESPGAVLVDVIGIGSGVVDRLKEMGHKRTAGINVSEKARDDAKFANLRAEIFWQLRERFQRGEIEIPSDPKLAAQLAGLKYEFDNLGRLKMESKEHMKDRGMKSPDRADMLAITYMQKKKRFGFGWG